MYSKRNLQTGHFIELHPERIGENNMLEEWDRVRIVDFTVEMFYIDFVELGIPEMHHQIEAFLASLTSLPVWPKQTSKRGIFGQFEGFLCTECLSLVFSM